MSDYRNNNNGRASGKPEPMWRPAYQGSRRRRRYIVKRPVYKQPFVWMLAAVAICIFVISGSLMNWGHSDPTQQPINAITANGNASTPASSGAPVPTNADGSPAATDSPAPTATPTPSPAPSPTPNEGPVVWDTSSGTYFHLDQNCQGMKNATQESMLSAYNGGKQPCPKCVVSEDAISARDAITVKALTALPSSLGNVVIQDPQVFDIYDVTPTLGKLSDKPALMVTATITGNLNLLMTNQPDIYVVRALGILTDASNNILWKEDIEPSGYSEAGLDMPRDLSFVGQLTSENVTGAHLTILVYASEGFADVDADIAVLGMYQTVINS